MASIGLRLGRADDARCRVAAVPASRSGASQRAVTSRIFWTFIAVHVLVWTLVPVATEPNCPLDMVEMLHWGRGWQLGYAKHPPLPAWIAQALFQGSCGSVWPLFLAAQVAVATSFWAAWRLAKEFLPPWPALCASLLLEGCVNYNFMTADLNNWIVLQPLWALSAWFLYRSLSASRLRDWFATGVCLGLGMLAKYDIAILILAMLLLPAVNARARARLFGVGPWVTMLTAVAIFSPHLVWMLQNNFPTIDYALSRAHNARSWVGHLTNPLEFLSAQLLFHLPLVVVAWPLWSKRGVIRPLEHDSFKRDYLLVICLGPMAVDLAISAVGGIKLQSMWGAPMWTFSGLLLTAWAGTTADDWQVYRRVLMRCAIAGVILALGLVDRNVALPHLRAKPSRIHFPGAQLAEAIQVQWYRQTQQPLGVVAGPWWIATSVGLHVPGGPETYDFANPAACPWSGDDKLRLAGGVVVWEEGGDDAFFQSEVRRRFPDAELLPSMALRWQTAADLPRVRFRVAVIRPAHGDHASKRPADRGTVPLLSANDDDLGQSPAVWNPALVTAATRADPRRR